MLEPAPAENQAEVVDSRSSFEEEFAILLRSMRRTSARTLAHIRTGLPVCKPQSPPPPSSPDKASDALFSHPLSPELRSYVKFEHDAPPDNSSCGRAGGDRDDVDVLGSELLFEGQEGEEAARLGDWDGRFPEKPPPLSPGSILVGTICIPGNTGADPMVMAGLNGAESRNEYSMEVLEWDAASECLIVAHSAYGDTQLCHLAWKKGKSRLPASRLPRKAPVASIREEEKVERSKSVDLSPQRSASGGWTRLGLVPGADPLARSTKVQEAEDAGVDRMDPRHRQMAEQRAALSRRPSLRTSAAAEPITISFSDAETFCTGMLNQFAGSLEGVVKQLKFGDDGCWEVSDMATHRFSLQVLQEEPEVRRQRVEWWLMVCKLFPSLDKVMALCEVALNNKFLSKQECMDRMNEAAAAIPTPTTDEPLPRGLKVGTAARQARRNETTFTLVTPDMLDEMTRQLEESRRRVEAASSRHARAAHENEDLPRNDDSVDDAQSSANQGGNASGFPDEQIAGGLSSDEIDPEPSPEVGVTGDNPSQDEGQEEEGVAGFVTEYVLTLLPDEEELAGNAAEEAAGPSNEESKPPGANWDYLLDMALLQAEKVACVVRRHVQKLSDQTFQDDTDKASILSALHARLTRQQCHMLIDEALSRLHWLHWARNLADDLATPRSSRKAQLRAFQDKQIVEEKSTKYFRLILVYKAFDHALRMCDDRLPKDRLYRRCLEKNSDLGEDACCSICMSPVGGDDDQDDDEKLVQLECTHLFHLSCSMEWFHRSAMCPNCRTRIEPVASSSDLDHDNPESYLLI